MKKAIVTAGANGIGRCIVEMLVSKGMYVFFIDLDEQAGQKLKNRYPRQLSFMHGDVGNKEDLDQFIKGIMHSDSPIEVFVHNAGISRGGIETCDYSGFEEAYRVGPLAAFYLAKQLRPQFKDTSIILISSTRSTMSQPNTESYSASKGAINALTHSMCMSLAGTARVNAISPGWIDTSRYHDTELTETNSEDRNQHPSKRIGRPEDIASLVAYLMSTESSFINGENIIVDGGMTKQMIYHGDFGWKYHNK